MTTRAGHTYVNTSRVFLLGFRAAQATVAALDSGGGVSRDPRPDNSTKIAYFLHYLFIIIIFFFRVDSLGETTTFVRCIQHVVYSSFLTVDTVAPAAAAAVV